MYFRRTYTTPNQGYRGPNLGRDSAIMLSLGHKFNLLSVAYRQAHFLAWPNKQKWGRAAGSPIRFQED